MFDNRIAFSEGWTLSDCFFDNAYRYQIQRLDDPGAALHGTPEVIDPIFEDDFKALEFVKQKANEGSEYHKLAFILDGTEIMMY